MFIFINFFLFYQNLIFYSFYGYRNCDSLIHNCYHQNCKRRGGNSIRRPNIGMLLLATGMLYILGTLDCLDLEEDFNNEQIDENEN